MLKHQLWVFFWFELGILTYWLKRAYYLVTGPNPIANSYTQFIQRCWIPLLVRGFIENLFFWMLFTPGVADKILAYFGWTTYGWAIGMITQVAPVAGLIGHTGDSILDFAVSKIPFIKDILPQMPGPMQPQGIPPNVNPPLPPAGNKPKPGFTPRNP